MSIASDPKGRGLQVTIKYGKGYEETWVSFAGLPTEIWEDITFYFGLDRDSVTGLTLSELVVSATNLAHAKGNIASTLGGTVIPQDSPPWNPPDKPAGDPWAEAGDTAKPTSKPAEPEVSPLLGIIEAATSVDELKRIWAENQADVVGEILDAWKNKGKALKAPA